MAAVSSLKYNALIFCSGRSLLACASVHYNQLMLSEPGVTYHQPLVDGYIYNKTLYLLNSGIVFNMYYLYFQVLPELDQIIDSNQVFLHSLLGLKNNLNQYFSLIWSIQSLQSCQRDKLTPIVTRGRVQCDMWAHKQESSHSGATCNSMFF